MEEDLDLWSWGNLSAAEMDILSKVAEPTQDSHPPQPAHSSWSAVASVHSASAAITERAIVPFQYAWRFHYGDDPSSPPESGPGTAEFESLAGFPVCDGMEHAPSVAPHCIFICDSIDRGKIVIQ
eukprot:SAG31_NODE_3665_length_4008_cov_1.196726_3_plen_125_part_00